MANTTEQALNQREILEDQLYELAMELSPSANEIGVYMRREDVIKFATKLIEQASALSSAEAQPVEKEQIVELAKKAGLWSERAGVGCAFGGEEQLVEFALLLRAAPKSSTEAQPIRWLVEWTESFGEEQSIVYESAEKAEGFVKFNGSGKVTPLYAAPQSSQPIEQPAIRTGDCLLCGHCASTGQPIELKDQAIYDLVAKYEFSDGSLWNGPKFTHEGILNLARALLSAHQAPSEKADVLADVFAAADRAIKKAYPGEEPGWWGEQRIPNHGILRAAIANEVAYAMQSTPAQAPVSVPEGWKLVHTPITEEMHVAAVKVLHRATGLDGLPQRMLDAMLAAAPAQAQQSEKDAELCRLRKIAFLIGSIFVHGSFKAETHNERELEKLLREQGTFFDTLAEFDAALSSEQNKGAANG